MNVLALNLMHGQFYIIVIFTMFTNLFTPSQDCHSASSAAIQQNTNLWPLRSNRIETAVFSIYFVFFLAYLFLSQESEFAHWFSLVILPSILLFVIQRRARKSRWTVKEMLATVGLAMSRLKNGILLAIIAALGLGMLQLVFSDQREEIWAKISSGTIIVALPIAFIFMLLTAGFTEEYFFRGILQTRIVRSINSRFWGVVVVSILFGFYHLPYAYLNPDWPSYGDWTAAIGSALGQGIPMGIALGAVYEKSKNNLLACVIMHSLFNALPAVAMINFF
ncbi:MAG: CPBP family intramembrane glutamic endopeptidase [Thermoleophilia bacterium]